jgi:hypothetical protein
MVGIVCAQESDTRARIYAQIQADPASSELTEAEIEALVDALTTQAEQAQEATLVQDPTPSNETTFGSDTTGTEGSTETQNGTLAAVLLALVLVGAAVWLWQRHNRTSPQPPQDSDSPEVL